MSRPEMPEARRLPWAAVAFLRVAAAVLGLSLLVALVHAIGLTGVVLLGCVVGSFAVVVLAVLRRRPISVD